MVMDMPRVKTRIRTRIRTKITMEITMDGIRTEIALVTHRILMT
jgi:hypothetical protein